MNVGTAEGLDLACRLGRRCLGRTERIGDEGKTPRRYIDTPVWTCFLIRIFWSNGRRKTTTIPLAVHLDRVIYMAYRFELAILGPPIPYGAFTILNECKDNGHCPTEV